MRKKLLATEFLKTGKSEFMRFLRLLSSILLSGFNSPMIRFKTSEWKLWVLVSALIVIPISAGTFQATLDRDQIAVGESATLQAILQNEESKSAPTLPQIPGLTIRPTGTSQQYSIVNGQSTHSLIFGFTITAAKEGAFTIPAITIRTETGIKTTRSLTLKVTQAEAINAGGKLAFARITISKNEVYVGEVIPAEIQFFVSTEGRNLQGPQIKGDGFVINKSLPHTQSKTRINNDMYTMLVFKTAITATKAGKIAFGPAQFNLDLLIRQTGRRTGNDALAEFFGGAATYQEHTILSDTVTLNVLPLPKPPTDAPFLGAIGNFSMKVKAAPLVVGAGDPITLKIDFHGKGSLEAMAIPPLAWDHFKSYPAVGTVRTSDALGLEGVKSFEQVVIPDGVEAKSIPIIRFSYFNPEKKSFVILSNAAVALTVNASLQPTAQATVVQPKSDETGKPISEDLIHIKPDIGQLRSISPPMADQPWFWVMNSLPCLTWLGFLAWSKSKERKLNNPRLQRRLQVHKKIRDGLHQLKQTETQQDAISFYTLAFRLLQERIGERLDIPSASVTEAIVEEAAEFNGTMDDENDLKVELSQLFHLCNLARYAAAKNGQSLEVVLSRLEKVLTQFEHLPKNNSIANRSLLPWLIPFIFSLEMGVFAGSNEIFNEANRAYEQGKYSLAVSQYQSIGTNQTSPALLLNLANAAWKSEQRGLAIASLAQAVQLAPRNSEVRANFAFLRKRVSSPTPTISEKVAAQVSFNEAAGCFVASNILLFCILILRQRSPGRLIFNALLFAGASFLVAFLLLIFTFSARNSRVVVMVKEASVKFGPVEESQSAFSARDGTELRLVDRRQDWIQVVDAANKTGWILQSEVVILP